MHDPAEVFQAEGEVTVGGYQHMQNTQDHGQKLRLLSTYITSILMYDIWPEAQGEEPVLSTKGKRPALCSIEDILRMLRVISNILEIRNDLKEFLPNAVFLEEELARRKIYLRSKLSTCYDDQLQ